MKLLGLLNALALSSCAAFHLSVSLRQPSSLSGVVRGQDELDRRGFLTSAAALSGAIAAVSLSTPQPAEAIGPIKLALKPTSYKATPCPPSKPIPGEKAMFGMRGLCVTVEADLLETSPKDLEKVGVYGFVVDGETGNSVLANNPDLR